MKVYCLFQQEYLGNGESIGELERIFLTEEAAIAAKDLYTIVNSYYNFEYNIEAWEVE